MKKLTRPPRSLPLVRRAAPIIASVALAATAGCPVGDSVGVEVIDDDGGVEPGDDAGQTGGDDAGN